MDEKRLKEINDKIKKLREEISNNAKKKQDVLLRLKNLEPEGLQAKPGRYVRPLFYRALKKVSFGESVGKTAVENLMDGVERYLAKIKKNNYPEYSALLEKNIPLNENLKKKAIEIVSELEKKVSKQSGMRNPYKWDQLLVELHKNTAESDWSEFNKEAAKIANFFEDEKKRLVEELASLLGREPELGDEIKNLEREKTAIFFADKYDSLRKRAESLKPESWAKIALDLMGLPPEELVKKATAEVETLERQAREEADNTKKRDETRTLLKKLSTTPYPDIRESAKNLEEQLDGNLHATEAKAQELKKTCLMRNKIKESMAAEFLQLQKKERFVARFTKNLKAQNGLAKEFDEFANCFESEFYEERFIERLQPLQEEIELFHEQITALNKIGNKHREIDLLTLKPLIKEITQNRNYRGFERLVSLLRWIVRYKDKIEDMPALMALILKKQYETAIIRVEKYKTEKEKKEKSEIETKKDLLGFKEVSDITILHRLGGLKKSLGDRGFEILCDTGAVSYLPCHNHVLSGARISLQKLGFSTPELMEADRVKIDLKGKQKRLNEIVELSKLIKKRNAELQAAE